MRSATTVQNWTPRQRGTREVCDFLDTSSENSVSTYNQPNLESTRNQPSFFCLKFWALVTHLTIDFENFFEVYNWSNWYIINLCTVEVYA
jgi:hypothetical protein